MVNIKQDFIPAGKSNRPGYVMKPKYITLHTTQNFDKGADGLQHVKFLKNGGGSAGVSWHFTVDSTGIIYQHLPLNENGWHAGDGGNGTGNRQSIGIEICENADGNFEKAVGYAIELVAHLIKTQGIALPNFVPHKHWSGKQCPRQLLSSWDEIVGKVAKAGNAPAPSAPVTNPQPLPAGGTYTIQKDDTYFAIARKLGTTVANLQFANPGVDPLKLQVGQVINLSAERPATYTIKAGDTLWAIAESMKGLTVGDLFSANPGIDPQKLSVGQLIKLTRGSSPAPAPAAKPSVVGKVVNAVQNAVKKNPYPLPTGVLKRGDRGAGVKQLQTALNAAYFKCGAPDGIFGAKTEDAVRRFQSMYAGLKIDGIYGSATRAKLDEKLKR